MISAKVGDVGKKCVLVRCPNVNLQQGPSSHRPVLGLSFQPVLPHGQWWFL